MQDLDPRSTAIACHDSSVISGQNGALSGVARSEAGRCTLASGSSTMSCSHSTLGCAGAEFNEHEPNLQVSRQPNEYMTGKEGLWLSHSVSQPKSACRGEDEHGM